MSTDWITPYSSTDRLIYKFICSLLPHHCFSIIKSYIWIVLTSPINSLWWIPMFIHEPAASQREARWDLGNQSTRIKVAWSSVFPVTLLVWDSAHQTLGCPLQWIQQTPLTPLQHQKDNKTANFVKWSANKCDSYCLILHFLYVAVDHRMILAQKKTTLQNVSTQKTDVIIPCVKKRENTAELQIPSMNM